MRLICVQPGAGYSTADVYNGMLPELRALGHECIEYRLDSRIDLSMRWMHYVWRRAGKPEPKPTSADALYHAGVQMIERALLLQADGILMWSGMFILRNILQMARRAHIRTGLVLTESPYDSVAEAAWAELVDVAWTNERSSVEFLRQRSGNPNVHYLPHAIAAHHAPEPNELDEQLPVHDVVFVGSLFWERVEVLEAVDWTGIDFGLYGEWSGLPSRHKLRRFLRGGVVDNRVTAALYRRAKIGLNLYRSSIGWGRGAPRITHAESLNPRALELAACGVCQVSDYRAEVDEAFGSCVPTFRTPAELEQILRRVLADPVRRRGMASLARRAVAGPEFTFAARAAQVSAQLDAAWTTPRLAKGA